VPAAYNRAPSAVASCCTTEGRNAHTTVGQRVLVRGEARRGGIIVLQCVRDELKGFPTLEIPEWTFDSHLGDQMKPTESPGVDCADLLTLKHLLEAAKESSKRDVVQAQHDSSSSGDADAQAIVVQDSSRRIILAFSEPPRVARRSPLEDDSLIFASPHPTR
jgi:hypothetical protein